MKGFINTIEALLGAVTILVIMMYLFGPQPIQETSAYSIAYDCLKYAKDSSNMDQNIRTCLPTAYDFTIKTCNTIDCSATLPAGKSVTSAEYIGQEKMIKLWVYR